MAQGIMPTSAQALVKAMAFLEERHRIIANNIANAGTPFYKARQAPLAEFQSALSKAIDAHRKGSEAPLALRSTPNIRDGRGGMIVRPVFASSPDAGVLKHDDNNVNLESEMSDLAQNTLMHGVFAQLLRKRLAGLKSAMAERVD